MTKNSPRYAARLALTEARTKYGMNSPEAIAAEREVMRLEGVGYRNEGTPAFYD